MRANNRRWNLVITAVLWTWTACTGTDGPSREKSAEFFGLVNGRSLRFIVSGGAAPATHTISYASNASFADRLGFTQEERNQANFILSEQTLVLGAEVESMVLLRSGDCLTSCTDYVNPPRLLDNPVVPNTSWETVSNVVVNTAAGRMDGGSERHSITVGPEVQVPTPAGTFPAHEVFWRIFPSGGGPSVDTRFWFCPGKGIVQWQKGGLTYKVETGLSP